MPERREGWWPLVVWLVGVGKAATTAARRRVGGGARVWVKAEEEIVARSLGGGHGGRRGPRGGAHGGAAAAFGGGAAGDGREGGRRSWRMEEERLVAWIGRAGIIFGLVGWQRRCRATAIQGTDHGGRRLGAAVTVVDGFSSVGRLLGEEEGGRPAMEEREMTVFGEELQAARAGWKQGTALGGLLLGGGGHGGQWWRAAGLGDGRQRAGGHGEQR